MLSKTKEKLILTLLTKKGREKSGLCIVEGPKSIETAGAAVDFVFHRDETPIFDEIVSTETPQDIAAVARVPVWTEAEIASRPVTVVLDGIQDPGNVGAILRLALGFGASLILVECADLTAPKVVRASSGALFSVPWIRVTRTEAPALVKRLKRPVLRLEKRPSSIPLSEAPRAPAVLIAGSEGSGILLKTDGVSIMIEHEDALESLNVGHAVAIALHHLYVLR